NLIEQPLAFLRSQSLWPLSLYLPQIDLQRAGFACSASLLALLPSLFLFLWGQEYLRSGIAMEAIKE
ncbi:MAG: carbohydrate ABC transporter permease, partial [Lachnospiraceae bacterium]|nr:carbohydrate ABC transporter permease [Lachnospiraceae bacterium]